MKLVLLSLIAQTGSKRTSGMRVCELRLVWASAKLGALVTCLSHGNCFRAEKIWPRRETMKWGMLYTGEASQIRHRNSCRAGLWRPVFQEQGTGSSFFFCILAGVPVRVFLLCFPSADAGSPVFLYFPKKIRLPAASLHCLHHIALPSCLSSILFSPFSPSPSSSPSLSLPSSRRRPPQNHTKIFRGINPKKFPEWGPSNTSNWKGLVPWRVEVHGSSSGMMATEYWVTRTL